MKAKLFIIFIVTLTFFCSSDDATTTSSGSTKTFAATGVLRDYDVSKPTEGKVNIDIFVRITGDTISIT